jgi:hypothetical protein
MTDTKFHTNTKLQAKLRRDIHAQFNEDRYRSLSVGNTQRRHTKPDFLISSAVTNRYQPQFALTKIAVIAACLKLAIESVGPTQTVVCCLCSIIGRSTLSLDRLLLFQHPISSPFLENNSLLWSVYCTRQTLTSAPHLTRSRRHTLLTPDIDPAVICHYHAGFVSIRCKAKQHEWVYGAAFRIRYRYAYLHFYGLTIVRKFLHYLQVRSLKRSHLSVYTSHYRKSSTMFHEIWYEGVYIKHCRIWDSHSRGHEISIFWDIKPCTPLKTNRYFRGTYRPQLQGRISQARNQQILPPTVTLVSSLAYSRIRKMKATCSSETSVDIQRTELRYIPKDKTT